MKKTNKYSPEVRERAVRFYRSSGARPQAEAVKAYIDCHRDAYGVEPICKVLQIAPSAYCRHAARLRNPELRSARAKQEEALRPRIHQVTSRCRSPLRTARSKSYSGFPRAGSAWHAAFSFPKRLLGLG
jgi:hypothetical protein